MVLPTIDAPSRGRATPDPMVPRWHRIGTIRRETHDTVTMELHAGQEPAARFLPGQFNMLYQYRIGEVPVSISGNPEETDRYVHTIRAVGTVTRAMKRLRPGEIVGVRGPFGSSWPMHESIGNDVVIIAGGIGLAPLRPAVYHLLAHRELYGRIVILYGTRTPADLLFRNELERWRARFDCDVQITVDRAATNWRGHVGVVSALIGRAPLDPESTTAMICGPEIMMRFTAAELQKRGISPDQIYLSMERNMKCAIGVCGHCQYGPFFICKDGPVFRYTQIRELLTKREL